MEKRFRFSNDKIRALPPNPPDARGTDIEFSHRGDGASISGKQAR